MLSEQRCLEKKERDRDMGFFGLVIFPYSVFSYGIEYLAFWFLFIRPFSFGLHWSPPVFEMAAMPFLCNGILLIDCK